MAPSLHAFTLIILLSSPLVLASSADEHARRGLAAADHWPGYASLCDLEAAIRDVNAPRPAFSRAAEAAAQRRGSSREVRDSMAPQPVQVFDNLYFLGTGSVSAWLYGDETGYILIDGLNSDDEAQRYIFEGMRKLGLTPAAIKGVLVTHGHGDHYGGADYVASQLGIDVMMSEADWRLVATQGEHPRFGPPPKQGAVVTDGQVIAAGTSRLSVYVTPGHTPGTLSPVLTVYDKGEPHVAMLWGGTGFNFGPHPAVFEDYASSAARMRDVARAAGVDVFLSNHPGRDGALAQMKALAARQDGTPHPFVSGEAGYSLFTVLEQCALAQAARFR